MTSETKRIQLPRMKRPAGFRETGVAKRRAVKAEEAESEAPLGTLSTHSSDDDDRDIDVSGERVATWIGQS